MPIRFTSPGFPVLGTARLLLRELTPGDAAQLLTIRCNEEINRFIGRSSAHTLNDIYQFIDARRQDMLHAKSVYWAIEIDGRLIGTICLWNIDYTTVSAEIGYELLPAYQGRGLMAEAIDKVIAYGFNNMHLNTITAWPAAENERSIKLLQRHQFKYAETIEGYLVYKLDNDVWRLTPPK
ncbi:GNAT family N-acetyltransferase [Mucilaginibacter sp. FT3.2]|uniref:GNAT family N-acetyltransferase n=1 Tax=Mucilaginibacter sp. FT3.2 TaxID=2723090 RepID=UPI00161B5E7F|nr:GNAT family N-acetyltransferase [Mucilaginibacter sp. FT3.2]MBB6233744.1 ribosomal-protein-alanine N-acetyltransferase [Mucilaginibacter sp. FT3.2]